MRRTAAAILALAATTEVTSVHAEFPKFEIPRLGIFRKKKEDPPAPAKPGQPAGTAADAPAAKSTNPAITTLRTDRDEKDRVAAAVTLRNADPRNDLEVLPTLMTSLQQDPSPTVRAAVAETIGKLKPVSVEAGATLEGAVIGDPSEAVRKAAQAALWQYHLNGYRSTAANAAIPQTVEPPLARPKSIPTPMPNPAPTPLPTLGTLTSNTKPQAAPAPVQPVVQPVARPISTGIGRGAIYPQTIEPPLAKPKPTVDIKPPVPSIEVPKFREETVVEEKRETKPEVKTEAKNETKTEVPAVIATPPAIPVPPPATVLTIPPPPSK